MSEDSEGYHSEALGTSTPTASRLSCTENGPEFPTGSWQPPLQASAAAPRARSATDRCSGYCVSIRQHTSAYVRIRQHT